MSDTIKLESDSESGLTAPPAEFVELFSRSQRKIYLFILSQIPNPVDAEEILQETNLVIWKKADRFQVGTNFSAWACQIARYEVLKFRERKHRDKLYFSDEFIAMVAEEAEKRGEWLESRRAALLDCIRGLRSRDRELIQKRYAPGESGKGLAEELGRPANSVYQSLGRIRRSLFECVNRRLAAESRS